MKRPFALIGFTYLITLAVANFLGLNAAVLLCGCAALGAVAAFVFPRLRRTVIVPTVFVCAFCALLSYSLLFLFSYQPAMLYDGSQTVMTADVKRCDYNAAFDKYYYIIEGRPFGDSGKIKMRLSSDKRLPCDAGDTIECDVTMFTPDSEGFYSNALYQRSCGVYLYCRTNDEITVTASHRNIDYYCAKIRDCAMGSLDNMLDNKTAGVIKGVLLGDDSSIPYSVLKSFRRSGIAHLFAVSGLHVSVLSGFLLVLLKRLRVKRSTRSIIVSLTVLFFMAVAGFSPSVARAGIMCIIYCVGIGFFRRSDSLNSLGFSVLVLLLINPFCAANMSFLLSVFATLGMVKISSPMTGLLLKPLGSALRNKKPIKATASTVSISLSAGIFTLPLNMIFFGSISLIAPLTNIICAIPSHIIFICGAIASLLGMIPIVNVIAMPFAFAAGICSKLTVFVSDILARPSFSCVPLGSSYVTIWLCGSLILLAAAVLVNKRRAYRLTAILSVICLLAGVLSSSLLYSGVYEIAVINQDDNCSVAVINGTDCAVIGSGGSYNSFSRIESLLDSRNVRSVSLLALDSSDSSDGAKSIAGLYSPDCIMLDASDSEMLSAFDGLYSNIIDRQNRTFSLGGNASVTVYEHEGQSAYYISTLQSSMLLCSKDMNVKYIPQECRNVDVAVFQCELPANYQLIRAKTALISGKTDNSVRAMLHLRESINDCLLISDYDRIVIQTRGSNDITLRKE